jgi:hypothetical protein
MPKPLLSEWNSTPHIDDEGACAMNQTLLEPKHDLDKDALPRLRKQLEREWGDVPDERIDLVAKHSFERFSGARVKEFVPVLAWRHARHHLQGAS